VNVAVRVPSRVRGAALDIVRIDALAQNSLTAMRRHPHHLLTPLCPCEGLTANPRWRTALPPREPIVAALRWL